MAGCFVKKFAKPIEPSNLIVAFESVRTIISLAKLISQNLHLFLVKLKNPCSKFFYIWRILLLSGVNTLRYMPVCSDTVLAGLIFSPFTRSPNVV